MTTRGWLLAPLLALAACESEKDPNANVVMASSVDQTCTADTDCIVVREGNQCDCECSYGAISIDAQEDWFALVAEASDCEATESECVECVEVVTASCDAGTCTAVIATAE